MNSFDMLNLCLNSLQVNVKTQLVVLSKEEGSGLGFSIAGGVDLEQKAITVSTVYKSSGILCTVNMFILLHNISLCFVLISYCTHHCVYLKNNPHKQQEKFILSF